MMKKFFGNKFPFLSRDFLFSSFLQTLRLARLVIWVDEWETEKENIYFPHFMTGRKKFRGLEWHLNRSFVVIDWNLHFPSRTKLSQLSSEPWTVWIMEFHEGIFQILHRFSGQKSRRAFTRSFFYRKENKATSTLHSNSFTHSLALWNFRIQHFLVCFHPFLFFLFRTLSHFTTNKDLRGTLKSFFFLLFHERIKGQSERQLHTLCR